MRTLTLYPLKRNLQKGVAYGLGAMALAVYLYTLDGGIEYQVFAGIAFLGGVWMAGKAASQLANPKPVFDADVNGFSVKGKEKRPWSEFRGVGIHHAGSGGVRSAKYVRVKVGKSMLGRHVQIGATEMSGAPEDMVAEIGRFAETMMSGVTGDPYNVPPVGAVHTPQAAPRAVTARAQQAATGGPVQSVPSFGERLFGRRKVL